MKIIFNHVPGFMVKKLLEISPPGSRAVLLHGDIWQIVRG